MLFEFDKSFKGIPPLTEPVNFNEDFEYFKLDDNLNGFNFMFKFSSLDDLEIGFKFEFKFVVEFDGVLMYEDIVETDELDISDGIEGLIETGSLTSTSLIM